MCSFCYVALVDLLFCFLMQNFAKIGQSVEPSMIITSNESLKNLRQNTEAWYRSVWLLIRRVQIRLSAARCYASAAYVVIVVSVCPSVSLSDTFVHSVKTNKYIFRIFSQPGNHTIPVFTYQAAQQYSDAPPSLKEVAEFRYGRQKSRFWANMWVYCMLLTVAHCLARSLRMASMTPSTLRAQKDDKSQSGGFIYIKIHIRR